MRVCVPCSWLGVSAWPIVDSFRQANRLSGPRDPETVMGTLFNWGNRRAFRDLLIKRNPSHSHTHTHPRLSMDRQTGKVTALPLATQCLRPHPCIKDPESAGGDAVYDHECVCP